MSVQPLTINVYGCARCGGTHRDLKFTELRNPPPDTYWRLWCMCPTLQQPILMKVTGDELG